MSGTLNHWASIFLIAAAQGVFLSIMLWNSKSPDKKNLFLGFLTFTFSIALVDNVWFWTELFKDFPHVLGVSMTFPFLYGPLVYLYFKEALKANSVTLRKDWRHFVVVVFVFIYHLPYYVSSAEGKLELLNSWYQSVINIFFIPLGIMFLLAFYAHKSFSLLKHFQQEKQTRLLSSKSWIGQIFFGYFLFVICFEVYYLLNYFQKSTKETDYIIATGMSLFIYFIGYLGFSKSKLLNGIKADSSKYQSTTLTQSASMVLFEKIKTYLEETKMYKDYELRLPVLASHLNITAHQLSQVINEHAHCNFSEFINNYRIEEAKVLIETDTRINQLAFEVGFNNKTSFYAAFKKNTGCSPNEYKKMKLDI